MITIRRPIRHYYEDGVDFIDYTHDEPLTRWGIKKMNMDEYGDEVEKLILTHGKTYVDKRLMENTLGLVNGEFAEKIKKQIRDGNEINQLELVKELGDVLFYVTALANHIGSDLQTVATNNIAKLHDRQKRNKLQGVEIIDE